MDAEPLSDDEIATLAAWIDAGAEAPDDEPLPVDPREHWAFQTPVRPPVPTVNRAAWSGNPVDRFLAAEHERQELEPSPPAESSVLLRRVYLDLIGLPPSPDELRTFLADSSSDAYEKVVDRLLASPQYGERWGRHWMDVWRYSDWDGYAKEVRESQPHIWRWRDWIVESLNADQPYDRMIIEMLAADEVAPLDPAAARPLLQEALTDRDWAVRVRARTLLGEQGVTDVDDAMRPAVAGQQVDSPDWQAIVSPKFSPRVFVDTDKGTVELELAIIDAPLTVANFMSLARKGFFNGIPIHRVVPDFVVQDGDPRGDGEGGPGYTIRDEINQRPYLRGTVGMALDWQDTGGSQFFITHSPQPHLDGRYTVFGQVVNGMDVVDRLVPGDAIRQVRVRDGVTPD